jgi:hypothetical protein
MLHVYTIYFITVVKKPVYISLNFIPKFNMLHYMHAEGYRSMFRAPI